MPDRPEHTRNKSSSFSFRSHKSDKDRNNKDSISPLSPTKIKVIDLHETEAERQKARFKGKGYTNPNKAVTEAEPAARQQKEDSTLGDLRGLHHKDWQGNPITDPDVTNPARPRLERPLDTIRSFEAAIEGGHTRRNQMLRAESSDGLNNLNVHSRRSSYVGDLGSPRPPTAMSSHLSPRRGVREQQQYPQYDGGYPRGPGSYSGHQSQLSLQHGGGQGGAYARRQHMPRMSSAPSFSPRQQHPPSPGAHGVGPAPGQNGHDYNAYHNYTDSYETNGESTGSPSEPWANSTDPSSENSSVDRIHAFRQSDGTGNGDAYGGVTGVAAPYERRGSSKADAHAQQQDPRAQNGYGHGQGYNQGYGQGQGYGQPPQNAYAPQSNAYPQPQAQGQHQLKPQRSNPNMLGRDQNQGRPVGQRLPPPAASSAWTSQQGGPGPQGNPRVLQKRGQADYAGGYPPGPNGHAQVNYGPPAGPKATQDKRKSWLKRTFGRS